MKKVIFLTTTTLNQMIDICNRLEVELKAINKDNLENQWRKIHKLNKGLFVNFRWLKAISEGINSDEQDIKRTMKR